MMRRLPLWGAGVLFLAFVGAGIVLGQDHGTTVGKTAAHTTPVSGTPVSGTPVSSSAPSVPGASGQVPTPVQVGAQLYAANCQTCHGKNGSGGKYRGIHGMSRIGFSRFKSIILYGRERMPGYIKTGLSTSNNLGALGSNGYLGNSKAPTDQQMQDLLAYLRTLPGASGGGFFGGGDD